jgi:hypothetical protein
VTFLWTCSGQQNEFFPPFWENATVRIAPGTANGEIIASVYNFEPNFSSIAVLNWSSTSLTVLSDFYNLPSANYYLNPGPAVVTKDNQKVLVGNEGLLANFEQIDGFNIFRVDDLIFKNGFD